MEGGVKAGVAATGAVVFRVEGALVAALSVPIVVDWSHGLTSSVWLSGMRDVALSGSGVGEGFTGGAAGVRLWLEEMRWCIIGQKHCWPFAHIGVPWTTIAA